MTDYLASMWEFVLEDLEFLEVTGHPGGNKIQQTVV